MSALAGSKRPANKSTKHFRQAHEFPLGRRLWAINHLLFAACYIFVLPFVWTYRAKFEREAYLQTLLVEHELHGRIPEKRMEHNARWLADTFGGSTYLFMWKKQAAYEWAMETQRQINAGETRRAA